MIYSNQIIYCNLIGAILFELKKYTLDEILNILIIITGTYSIYRGFTLIIDDDSIIGKICIATSCIVFLSPIQLIYRVIKEKNYNLIPIYTAYISLVSTSCWVVYGIFITDINVIFPNFIGLILAIIQIVIFQNYKKKYHGIGEKDSTSTIGIESTENDKDKRK